MKHIPDMIDCLLIKSRVLPQEESAFLEIEAGLIFISAVFGDAANLGTTYSISVTQQVKREALFVSI